MVCVGMQLATAEHEGVMYFLHAAWQLQRLEAGGTAASSDCSAGGPASGSPHGGTADTHPEAAEAAGAPAPGGHHPSDAAEQRPQLQRQQRQHPRLIVFEREADGCTAARWASADEQQVALEYGSLLFSLAHQLATNEKRVQLPCRTSRLRNWLAQQVHVPFVMGSQHPGQDTQRQSHYSGMPAMTISHDETLKHSST